jgi:hypothetical protein
MMQTGGVILNSSLYNLVDNHGIKPINDMLDLQKTKVTLLTASSLNGFMFKVDIGNDIIEYPYLDLLPGSQRFSVGVKSFIIKIVVVSTQENDKLYPLIFNTTNIVGDQTIIKKEAVSPDSFEKEAKVQDSIWIKSVSGSRPAICPSVAYASILTDDVSDQLLGKLQERLNPNDNFYENVTISYLAHAIYNKRQKSYYPQRKLGILLMPTIPNARTFYRFRRDNPNQPTTPEVVPEVVRDVIANILAQIVRIFIESKIIHLDLHVENVMVYKENQDDGYKSKIIDFGRASRIDSGSTDAYFSREEKAAMLEINARMEIDFNDVNKVQKDERKIIFMRNVMDYIIYHEKRAYQKVYPGRNPGHYQLQWIKHYIDNEILLSAFNKLPGMMLVNIDRGIGISYSTINRNHRYRLDFPPEPEAEAGPTMKRANAELEPDNESEPEPKHTAKRANTKLEPDMKGIPGGKSKKSKQTKKSKTTKKSKKSKKSKTL